MCGIVGYIGSKEAYPVLIKGLHRLEYRGYDSSGVAMISDEGKLNIYKAKGKVAALEHFAESKDRSGTVGIAHTRWATHGEPNDTNAHPHASQSGDLAIVHNGTIENYTVVKKALEQHGYAFRSETDTEVVVQLIDYIRTDTGCMLFEAVREACHQIVGAYAIAVIDRRNPNQIVVARKSSPLVIGVGDGEYFIASDATPIVEYTNRVVYLNDDEIAVINRGESLHVFNMDNKESKVNIQKLRMSISELEKGGYPHFMLKEIFEQPRTLRDCIRGRVSADGKHVVLSGVLDNKERFLDAHRILIVACGTSWHAALIGKHLFEDMCRIPVEVEYASEFRYRNPVVSDKDVLIAMSQSGETADTLAALELAKEQGAFVFGICNVIGSSIPRATDSGCYIHVGPEIGVASTKAFTGQVTVLAMMALMLGRMKGTIADEAFERVTRDLHRLPELLQEVLELDTRVKDLSKIFTYAKNFLYLGRGYNYPGRARRGAQTQRDFVYPCRRVSRRRDEARYDRPDRRRHAHGGDRSARQDLRQDGEQHPADQGTQRPHHRPRHARRRGGGEDRRLRDRDSGGMRMPLADPYVGAVAAAGLLRGRQQGPQRRPAAQSGQVGDCGVSGPNERFGCRRGNSPAGSRFL